MNRPSLMTYAIGNPLVALAVTGAGLFALYRCWSGEMSWVMGAIALIGMSWTFDANGRIEAYRSWKRAWDGIADAPERPATLQRPSTKVVLAISLVAVVGSYLYANRHQPGYEVALIWLIGISAIFLLFLFIRRTRKATSAQQTPDKTTFVSISVAQPLVEIPPLATAFDRLPTHCRQALKRRPTRSLQ